MRDWDKVVECRMTSTASELAVLRDEFEALRFAFDVVKKQR